jgi:hypothetical protein
MLLINSNLHEFQAPLMSITLGYCNKAQCLFLTVREAEVQDQGVSMWGSGEGPLLGFQPNIF